jgi:hypothetical protein
MRIVSLHLLFALILGLLASPSSLCAQQAPETFRWIDFNSHTNPRDQDTVIWVTRSLVVEKWTAIREIGVEYDAALVVTADRANPQAAPTADTFTVWNVSLTTHEIKPLVSGANLRWLDWMRFAADAPMEPAALFDSCSGCGADLYFTAFHYDPAQHSWVARWMRGGLAVPLWSANPPNGVSLMQAYAGLAEPNGRELIGTWSRYDYHNNKRPEDLVYVYDLDPQTGTDRMRQLTSREAEAFKQKLCSAEQTVPGLLRGQDGPLCVPQAQAAHRWERKPVTTPPANNHGQSVPPTARH